MRPRPSSVVFVGSIFGLFFLLFSRGYFDGCFVSIYSKCFKYCNYCYEEGHGAYLCPSRAVEHGALARLVIPDVGVNVACYEPYWNAQEVTDERDSAAIMHRENAVLVADHNYQGFNPIRRCKPGTAAYMQSDEGVKEYVCTAVTQGYNVGTQLTDLEGAPLENYEPGGFTAYTCNYFKDSITIAHFAPVDE